MNKPIKKIIARESLILSIILIISFGTLWLLASHASQQPYSIYKFTAYNVEDKVYSGNYYEDLESEEAKLALFDIAKRDFPAIFKGDRMLFPDDFKVEFVRFVNAPFTRLLSTASKLDLWKLVLIIYLPYLFIRMLLPTLIKPSGSIS